MKPERASSFVGKIIKTKLIGKKNISSDVTSTLEPRVAIKNLDKSAIIWNLLRLTTENFKSPVPSVIMCERERERCVGLGYVCVCVCVM